MATANTKLTVDTSQAMMAINGLNTAWVNASAKLNVVGKAIDFIASKWDYLNKTINDSATFMDAVKDESGVAAVQMAMSVTEGQIKPMELARQQNILMQGSLKMTQDQFDLVAKSAIALADATGGDANAAFADLSRSLVSGSVRSLAQFGIVIEDGGTKAERTAKVMERLSRTYGGYQVEVTNASDATAKMNAQMELQQMLAARSLDKVSQRLSQFKAFYFTEFVPSIIDAFAGTRWSASAQIIDGIKAVWEESRKLESESEQKQVDAAAADTKRFELEKSNMAIVNESRKTAIENEIANLKNLRTLAEDMNKQYGVSDKRLGLIQLYGTRTLALQKELLAVSDEERKNTAEYDKNSSSRLDAGAKAFHLEKESLSLKKRALEEVLKQDRMQNQTNQYLVSQAEMNSRILFLKESITFQEGQLSERAKNVDMWSNALADTFANRVLPGIKSAASLLAKFGVGGNAETDAARQARLEREQREREQNAEKNKAAWAAAEEQRISIQEANNQKLLDMERRRDEEWTRIEREGYEERLKIGEENYNRKVEAYTRENEKLQDIANKAKEKAKQKEKKESDEAFEKKLKTWEEETAAQKKYLDDIKAKTIEVSGVVLGAIFAEKKARDGLSKSEYVMKQLAAYMKGQALRYAAEAIGHGAQALAASVLAPATAPALWAASAADAAAAAAFGLGAAAAGKMSGKPSGGSKSESSSSKGPQRETLTGTSVQRSEITVILGGRGVVIGNADELARQIGTIMGDAQRRGVVRA